MRALTWQGPNYLQVDTVDDLSILNPRDAIIRVTLSSVCGSDLHLLGGYVQSMQAGDIIGHEFLGEVVETGSGQWWVSMAACWTSSRWARSSIRR